MSFFEPAAPRHPEPEPLEPEWAGPPIGVVGGISVTRAVLIHSDDIGVVAHRFLCYPTGIEFTLQFWFREIQAAAQRPYGLFPPPEEGTGEELLFGVQYPDGTKWTSVSMWRPNHREEAPPRPALFPRSGGGGGRGWRQTFWMWPLPEEGTLTFVVAWPGQDISERSIPLDTRDLRRAATEAEALWAE